MGTKSLGLTARAGRRRCGRGRDDGAFCDECEKLTRLRMRASLLERQPELTSNLHFLRSQPAFTEGAQRASCPLDGRLHLTASQPHTAQDNLCFSGLHRVAGPLRLVQSLGDEVFCLIELTEGQVHPADLGEDRRPVERSLQSLHDPKRLMEAEQRFTGPPFLMIELPQVMEHPQQILKLLSGFKGFSSVQQGHSRLIQSPQLAL